ncbi:GAF and ANTAR domain-containing protein [Pseudokineococcus marinus]|uniref:GAF and ANTAR domain-containing protein n=2 Tax=Pseudokineococcus marinus TaxID=351215 RepID=A0A849C1S1_9ACTN|nr:GAF and ANTAR domain-containing protein [Pseudokineococcus marinus]
MARDLQRAVERPDVMTRTVRAAVALVPGAEDGSVSLVQGRRRITSEGVSSDLPRTFDHLQVATGQGPCLDSAFEHLTVRVDDLSADERWPDLAVRAADTGVRSCLCLQLFVEGDDLGALNLVSRRPRAFDDESEQVGLLLASHAAIAVADALHLQGVRRALANRDLIGQAKGVLMERHKVTSQQAFDLLVRASQDANRKLVDVAEALTATGDVGG